VNVSIVSGDADATIYYTFGQGLPVTNPSGLKPSTVSDGASEYGGVFSLSVIAEG